MGLELKFSIIQSQNCKSFYVRDDTGIYNATTNPTGYGAPNPTIAAMLMASFSFLLTDGTTVTLATADGFYPLFPNTSGVLYQVPNTALGLAADVAIADFLTNATYHVSQNLDGSGGYSTTKSIAITCQGTCCVATLLAAVNNSQDCGCENESRKKWSKANSMLESVYNSLQCSPQLPNKASADLIALTEYCAGTGGCGCT